MTIPGETGHQHPAAKNGNSAGDVYDETPYRAFRFPETHPARLAALASLHGMDPPDPARARVLEFGCASGSNLAEMARTLPAADFHGIDLSAAQIRQGRHQVAAAGLGNIRLDVADILDVDFGDARYDYIVAHGVFSWVPDAVRERLFALIRRHLAPNGVAYVSYNTLPGWSVNEAVAEMMRLEADGIADAEGRLQAARASLSTFHALFDGARGPHAELVRHELGRIGGKDAVVFLHDELEATSDPCYLLQFVEWAAEHGLRHFTDASLPTLWPNALPKETRRALMRRGLSWLKAQQYLDYLEWRHFRRSLLCHVQAGPEEFANPERLADLYVQTRLCPDGPIAVAPGISIRYRLCNEGRDGDGVMLVSDPLIQAFVHRLGASPARYLSFRETLDAAIGDVGIEAADSTRVAVLQDWVMGNIARGWMDVAALPREVAGSILARA